MGSAMTEQSNPFATRWTRPGAVPFDFDRRGAVDELVERLAESDWRGAIVGPHGSGKSTLVAALLPAIEAAGRTITHIKLHSGQ
jgi:polynucleotide 5'-kinase involved in rRNA processing